MMRNIYTFLMLLMVGLTQTTVNAQVVIGGDTDNPHPHALLQIQSDGRGVIMPSVEQRNQLPNVDPVTGDYIVNPNDDGLVMYSKEEKDIMRFDGEKWESASKRSLRGSKNISLLSSDKEDVTLVSVLGITAYKTLIFNVDNDLQNYKINNLGLVLSEEDGSITFPNEGIYRVSVSVKSSTGGGLSVGNLASILNLEVLVDEDWLTLGANDYLFAGLLVSAQKRDSTNSFNMVKQFDAGTKIRFRVGLKADTGLAVGAGVTFVMNDPDTFIYIEKLD
ncbi:hypothetical protein [Weeksella sp. HMSC059D05]|uniref:hypothetical protein n=1 Tax=Weeksella sp. HMSC059D05 TaxID=1715139 RepID=UPI0008A19FDF|nr:hypothetical protein [Weeksella sp. HMSC059D05]OFM82636.1 hypothetical protein HMPREF2660_02990 [Weeksella sp. HMSC059D05]